MSVPARSNKPGTFGFSESFVTTTTRVKANDGSVSTSQTAVSQAVHSCTKSALIKAAISPKTSFNIPFRTPTTFDRGIREVKYNSGIWEQTSTGTTYSKVTTEGVPDVKASWSMLGCPPFTNGNLVSIDTNQRNRARTEALLKLKDAKVNLGETLGEARGTVSMLSSRVSQLATHIVNVAKWARKPKSKLGLPNKFRIKVKNINKKRNLHPLSDVYLEMNYGWLPLMSEIHGLYELAMDQTKVGTVKKVSREVWDDQSFQGKVIHTGWESSSDGRRSHKCVLYAVLDNAKVRDWNRASVTNPLATTWQLTRLSMVVDWMIPIGNFLECLTANWGVEFLGGYDSQWCEYRSEARLLPSGSVTEITPRSVEMDAFAYRRQRLTSFPAPVPYIKSPFTSKHTLDAIALIHKLHFL